jgi:hypothetical protein
VLCQTRLKITMSISPVTVERIRETMNSVADARRKILSHATEVLIAVFYRCFHACVSHYFETVTCTLLQRHEKKVVIKIFVV